MSAGAERGVRWDDPAIGIEWPIVDDVTVSDKDRAWPDLDITVRGMSAVLRALERVPRQAPVRVGLVGAGYAGRGFAARVIRRTPGMELVVVSNRTIAEA